MGEDKKFKYNNHLDQKLKHIEKPRPLASEDKWEKYTEKKNAAQSETINSLLSFYEINPLAPQKWKNLAIALANDHVEAMKFKDSPGRKTVWDGQKLFALHGLDVIAKKRFPELKKQTDRVEKFPEIAKGTFMESVVQQATVSNLVGQYHKRKKNQEFRALMLIKEVLSEQAKDNNQAEFFEYWIKKVSE